MSLEFHYFDCGEGRSSQGLEHQLNGGRSLKRLLTDHIDQFHKYHLGPKAPIEEVPNA
ncbi:hypothetical protein ACPOL_0569 [Acidisarcina polymorpha]|uniref:Uncharacterized protein n=1 Tax=Acidisarcina polymorpha TaxID=2211140 RepID=A0A2Z5FTX4_9BACT|nr:hypothetical protein ACPOL_0569 [Acidisarcina polymorpha]